MNLSLIWHTLAPLRWEQVVYRPIRIAQFQAYRMFPSLTSHWTATGVHSPQVTPTTLETVRTVFENYFTHLQTPLSEQALESLLQNRFTLLNRTLEIPRIDWNQRYENHLWNYQFHYFDYVISCARALVERADRRPMRQCQQFIESWIATARIGHSDGWDAYPISLRVVNWIYAYSLIADRYEDVEFLRRWRLSIYAQLEFLNQHLEYHLLANHLFKNAKALVIGGLFFADDAHGRQWLTTGERLLWREFDEQVLKDGGHYERSPMYHALCLADAIECFALLQAFKKERGLSWDTVSPTAIRAKLQAMTSFLRAMSYADGTLALFNDAANDEDARPLLEAATRTLGMTADAQLFPITGYYAWRSPDETEQMIVDAGPPGAKYNLAHAHCDLLSYELRLDGKPFIVDSGVHGYGGDKFREYSRSTRAHNTVIFDGREQSEVWGTFRIGRVAEVLDSEVKSEAQQWYFQGSYRPYYDRNLVHERRIRRLTNGQWVIEDIVQGSRPQRAQSFIHLHPDVDAIKTDDLQVECKLGTKKILIKPLQADQVAIIEAAESPYQGWYFPDFGIARPSKTICFEYLPKVKSPFGYTIEKCG